jgi:hypothetical protein
MTMSITCPLHYIAVMEKGHTSQKKAPRAERFQAAYPVKLNGKSGVAKNISASGVFIEFAQVEEVGSAVQFTIDLATPSGTYTMNMSGEVVRVEKVDGRIGLAVKILQEDVETKVVA